MKNFLKLVLTTCMFMLIAHGQANAAPALPPLEEGWARVFIEIQPLGHLQDASVYINDRQLPAAEREYLVIDLLPGNYETRWMTNYPASLYSQKGTMTVNKGEVRFFRAGIKQAHLIGGALGGVVGVAIEKAMESGEERNYEFVSSVSELPKVAEQSPAKLALLYSKFRYTKLTQDINAPASAPVATSTK